MKTPNFLQKFNTESDKIDAKFITIMRLQKRILKVKTIE